MQVSINKEEVLDLGKFNNGEIPRTRWAFYPNLFQEAKEGIVGVLSEIFKSSLTTREVADGCGTADLVEPNMIYMEFSKVFD